MPEPTEQLRGACPTDLPHWPTQVALIGFACGAVLAVHAWARLPVGPRPVPPQLLLLPALAWLAWRARSDLHRHPLRSEVVLLGLLLLACVPGVLLSSDTRDGVLGLGKLSVYVAGYLLFAGLIRTRATWHRVLCGYVAAAVVALTAALWTYWTTDPQPLRLTPDVTPSAPGPNALAFLLHSAVVVSFGFGLAATDRSRALLHLGTGCFLWFGIVLTYSRASWLATLVAVCLLLAMSARRVGFVRTAVFGVCFALTPIATGPKPLAARLGLSSVASLRETVVERAESGGGRPAPRQDRLALSLAQRSRRSATRRVAALERYRELIAERPLFGMGIRTFRGSPHNSYVAILAYGGVFASLLMLAFLVRHARNVRAAAAQVELGPVLSSTVLALFVGTSLLLAFGDDFLGSYYWAALGLQGAGLCSSGPDHAASSRRATTA